MRFTTGVILGSVIGVSSIALMNMDKRDMRKMQRKGKKLMNRAEDLMDNLRGMM